jgi:hypothetical protein
MASLNDLDTEAQSVMSQQQEMEAQQQEQEAVLAEVTGRREKQQGEVRVWSCMIHLPVTWQYAPPDLAGFRDPAGALSPTGCPYVMPTYHTRVLSDEQASCMMVTAVLVIPVSSASGIIMRVVAFCSPAHTSMMSTDHSRNPHSWSLRQWNVCWFAALLHL